MNNVVSSESQGAWRFTDLLTRNLWTLSSSLAVGLALLLPLVLVIRDGLTLTGVHEESVGYRYFYTLRMLYGDGERPWLPQGQLVGLVHLAIQLLLTGLGFPPTQLFPRIDLFVYLAVAIPLLLTVAAFAWAAHPLRSIPARLGLGAALVAVSFDERSWGFYMLTKPDYHPWAGAISMLTVGWLLRLAARDPGLTTRHALLLRLFGGACLAIKPTYVIFPLAVGLFMLSRAARTWRTFGLAAGSTLLAMGLFGALTFAYYLGDVRATGDHFRLSGQFAWGQVGQTPAFADWLVGSALQVPPDIVTLAVLLPLLLGLSCLLLPRRSLCLSLLPGAAFSVWFLYQRFTSATMFEASQYFLAASTAWAGAVLGPWAAQHADRRTFPGWLLPATRWLMCAGLATLAVLLVSRYPSTVHSHYALADAGQQALARFIEETPGRTLFLIPTNAERPLTVDSAIFKGGMDIIGPNAARWPASPLMRVMFPDRQYAVEPPQIDPSPYAKVVFASFPSAGGKPAAFERVRDVFGVTADGLDCPFETAAPSPIVIGCRVLWGPLAQHVDISGFYVAEMRDVAGTRVITPDGQPASLAAGNTVLVGRSSELLRLGENRVFAPVAAEEGQRVRLANLGPWLPQTGRLGGLGAVYSGGRWRIDTPIMQPANPNNRFEAGSPEDPIPGWWISPGEAEYEITRMVDSDGAFVRIRALKPSSYLVVNGGQPLPTLQGVPITVYGQIRAHRTIEQKLTVHRPGYVGSGPPLTDFTSQTGQWNVLSVRLPRVEHLTAGDNFSLGLYNVEAGDLFDIRELSLVVGLLP